MTSQSKVGKPPNYMNTYEWNYIYFTPNEANRDLNPQVIKSNSCRAPQTLEIKSFVTMTFKDKCLMSPLSNICAREPCRTRLLP